MIGWEAFGAIDVNGSMEPSGYTCRPYEWMDVPDDEITDSIQNINIKMHGYGDDTSSVFVHINGLDKDRVEAAFARARLFVMRDAFGIMFSGEG